MHIHDLEDLYQGGRGRRLCLGGYCFERGRRQLFIERETVLRTRSLATPPVAVPSPGACALGIHAERIAAAAPSRLDDREGRAVIDAGAVVGAMELRYIKPGERWQALGAPGHHRIRDGLKQFDWPTWQRRDCRVLADEHGVLWVPGWTIADRARLTEHSRTAWQLRRDPNE